MKSSGADIAYCLWTHGVAPYNGDVPVTQNSRTVIEKAAGSYNYYM